MQTQILKDQIWYAPFQNNGNRNLKSAYEIDADPTNALELGKPFTVSLDRVFVSQFHLNFIQQKLHIRPDLAIISRSAMGSSAPIERVHDLIKKVDTSKPFVATDLISDDIYLCDDFTGDQHLYVELGVINIDTGKEYESTLEFFRGVADKAGSVFPAVLPYVSLADGLVNTMEKLIEGAGPVKVNEIVSQLLLKPPQEHDAKIMQCGRFVVFNEDIDASSYELTVNGMLTDSTGKFVDNISYAVFRIEKGAYTSFYDDLVQQEVAELLTLLNQKSDGQGNVATQAALERLTELVKSYVDQRKKTQAGNQ